jgi:Asp-tRNA(Asn)/Glu-tRNA(Gln) amidotransferase A subunit family amidase
MALIPTQAICTVLMMSVVEVANRIMQGEQSSVQVVESALAAIERGKSEIGAIVEVRAEAALREAEEADRTRGPRRSRSTEWRSQSKRRSTWLIGVSLRPG